MENLKKMEQELFMAKYGIISINTGRIESFEEVWETIRTNDELLKWSIKPIKDKFGERDLVNGITICDTILRKPESVDETIYSELINLIYSNENIARIVQDGYCNGGYSFLLMSLWNQNLKLTEEQKQFAVNEAMNKIGTKRYKEEAEEYSKKLEKHGVTDNITVSFNANGSINPIGAKTMNKYLNYLCTHLSDTQAHGSGVFDIRYYILRNSNWTEEEKQKLIMDFWFDTNGYDETLNQWEWGLINSDENYCDGETLLQIDEIYFCDYEELLELFKNPKIANVIWEEILFLKLMRKLRPQQWELPLSGHQYVLKGEN